MASRPASAAATDAQKRWELENSVQTSNKHYTWDVTKVKALDKEKPWKSNMKYFNAVRMSALSLIKIVMHAKTGQGKQGVISADKGNWVEVMGLLNGYYTDNTFVILDSFALPVEANEVECNLNEAAMVYMINYIESAKKLGKQENAIGWYHSHPGYGCFLSGTDVRTQRGNQANQDPFIALVVDPVKTISTGRVEIKAFRTFPEGYTPNDLASDDFLQHIPQDQMEQFGAYANQYYEVPITVFRSEADSEQLNLLWNKYWMKTLSTSPLVANRFYTDKQLVEVGKTLAQCEAEVSAAAGRSLMGGQTKKKDKDVPATVAVNRSMNKVTAEVLQGLLGMAVKQRVFNGKDQ